MQSRNIREFLNRSCWKCRSQTIEECNNIQECPYIKPEQRKELQELRPDRSYWKEP